MKTTFEQLKDYKSENNQTDFTSLIEKFLSKLERYVKHRIKTFEAKRKLPVNYYSPADVLAEVYLRIYNDFDNITNEKQLKVKLFKTADEVLEELVKKHDKKFKKIPVDKLLKEELKLLYEDFTADADGELILIEELDDIEYKQNEFKPKIFLFDKTAESGFARVLNLSEEDFKNERFRNIFGNIYASLPELTRHVLDLAAQGELDDEEIAAVVGIESGQVREILEGIELRVKKNK